MWYIIAAIRGVAQFGRAPRSGRGGRKFKSCHLDHAGSGRFLRPDLVFYPQGYISNPLSAFFIYQRVIIMNIAVVYSSVTGNTEKVAEAIKNAIAASGENVTYFGKPQSGIEADVYFIGSWTDKGTCSAETAEMLKEANGKKIAYFGTAGFGGEQSYFDALSSRALSLLPKGNEVLGSFFCQGKMPMSVRERYVKMITAHPDDKKLQVSLDNFDAALTHPDEEDLEKAAEWAKNILKK